MARAGLKAVSVYVTEGQLEKLQRGAELEQRSLSNFLLARGLERAEELIEAEKAKRQRKRTA